MDAVQGALVQEVAGRRTPALKRSAWTPSMTVHPHFKHCVQGRAGCVVRILHRLRRRRRHRQHQELLQLGLTLRNFLLPLPYVLLFHRSEKGKYTYLSLCIGNSLSLFV